MRTGLLRIRYWAIDPDTGARAELLAESRQHGDGQYDGVFCTDPRAVDAVLEMRTGDRDDQWLPVRTRRVPPGEPRLLPTSDEI